MKTKQSKRRGPFATIDLSRVTPSRRWMVRRLAQMLPTLSDGDVGLVLMITSTLACRPPEKDEMKDKKIAAR